MVGGGELITGETARGPSTCHTMHVGVVGGWGRCGWLLWQSFKCYCPCMLLDLLPAIPPQLICTQGRVHPTLRHPMGVCQGLVGAGNCEG